MVLGVKRSIVDRTISTDQSRPADVPPATVSESRLAGPPAVVLVTLIRWLPADSVAATGSVRQVVQLPVGANDGVAAATPSTVTAAGRVPLFPFAYLNVRVAG